MGKVEMNLELDQLKSGRQPASLAMSSVIKNIREGNFDEEETAINNDIEQKQKLIPIVSFYRSASESSSTGGPIGLSNMKGTAIL